MIKNKANSSVEGKNPDHKTPWEIGQRLISSLQDWQSVGECVGQGLGRRQMSHVTSIEEETLSVYAELGAVTKDKG